MANNFAASAGFIGPTSGKPSTAVPGVGDEHDDNVYSALVFAHGGQGQATIFVSGVGAAVPAISSTAILTASVPSTYVTYTKTTTDIEQSGNVGNTIGDFTCRAIGVTFDTNVAGRPYGATPVEVIDVLGKSRMEVKISGKRRIGGPVLTFPQVGGAMGFSTATSTSFAQNSLFATGRRISTNFQIARNDLLSTEVTVDAALNFSDTSFAVGHAGQASLAWVIMIGTARSDVR